MYNINSGATFVVHHDTQKGVGIKINYSRGLIRSTLRNDLNRLKHHIPG